MALDHFAARHGFARRSVSLANWRKAPFSRWSFSHVREIAPTAPMHPGLGRADEVPEASALWREAVDWQGKSITLDAALAACETDVFLALKGGKPVALWQAPHADAATPHLLFSVSKSLTALLAGALETAGVVDLAAPVSAYVPEAGSAYRDASLRHLLDMRVSLTVDERYGDETGWGARYCRAVLWDPQGSHPVETHASLLLAIEKGEDEHGGPFRYRSPNTDALGLALARAAGKPLADLAFLHLWAPLGSRHEAYVTVDREGTAQAAGGMCATAFDLARVGEMMRGEGALNGTAVLPPAFVRDTLQEGDPQAWNAGDFAALYPAARYRNKWYVLPSGAFFASGIHGQWLFVDPARAVTLVKLSSQADAKSDPLDQASLRLLQTVAARL